MHITEIKNKHEFGVWLRETSYDECYKQIEPLIAKANQQPTIDAMRFEAAKAAMSAMIANPNIIRPQNDDNLERDLINFSKVAASYADALIAELQKPKP